MKIKIYQFMLGAMMLMTAGSVAAQAANPTPMEAKFGVSDSSILFILIGVAIMLTILILTITSAITNLAESKELWKNINFTKIPFILLLVGLFDFQNAFANAYPTVAKSAFILDETTFWILVLADVFLFGVAMYFLLMLKRLIAAIRAEVEIEPAMEAATPSWFANIYKRLTDAVPIERETDVMTDHEYDGIRELDNNLPPWWKWMFYLTIVWSFAYMIFFHLMGTGWSSAKEYDDEVAFAKQEVDAYLTSKALNVDENSIELIMDQGRIDQGAAVFKRMNCAQCHGQLGEGGQGPNLTDQYWINGGKINTIFSTIKYGVPQKGMIPWGDQLTAIEMQNVATYIVSMAGSNPPNGKEPQGDLYTPENAAPAPAPVDSTLTVPAVLDSVTTAMSDANPQ